MPPTDRVRAALSAAVTDAGSGMSKADRLCHACVEVLTVDGASLSLMHEGTSRGTVGASGELSRRLDELQFTFGEGPCFDAMRTARPVMADDLSDPREQRWPAFSEAGREAGVRAVYAVPVSAARSHIGVLDLFRRTPGPFSPDDLSAGLLAAELASLPLLDLLSDAPAALEDGDADAFSALAALERVEVYQATGMLMAQLDCGPTDALVRLRAHAFSVGMTASEVAWQIVDRRLTLEADPPRRRPDGQGDGA
jgi:hypothetical protein